MTDEGRGLDCQDGNTHLVMVMTKRLIRMMVLLMAPLTSTGCLVARDRGHGPVVVGAPPPRPYCHPSEYWDGYSCRQKGWGHDHHHHWRGHYRDDDDRGWHR